MTIVWQQERACNRSRVGQTTHTDRVTGRQQKILKKIRVAEFALY